jgi:hypothetical protein
VELADMDVQGLTDEEIAVAKLAGRFFLSRRKCWRTFGGAG